jgi:hypothetical protein
MNSFFEKFQQKVVIDTPCSQMHSFGPTGLSSGLATRMTWRGPASDFIFVPSCVIVFGLRFK